MELRLPRRAAVLKPKDVKALAKPAQAAERALTEPIGSPPLAQLVAAKHPQTAAITISDITRPATAAQFIPAILKVLNDAGLADSQIVIIIGTGMHRPSTAAERDILLGREILDRIEVIDHDAHDPAALVKVSNSPPVSVNRRFAEAQFRIVTGCIEPHFMAGFSGGRKGVCPALVDLQTIQRFHGYETLADPRADNGILEGNPCHEIALEVARKAGVDFLFNVAVTLGRDGQPPRITGIYCGDLVEAHLAGCKQVGEWATAQLGPDEPPFDLVITGGGGYPLDATFYQTGKGMCAAGPALAEHSTLLVASQCAEGMGSAAFAELMLGYDNDWRRFLADIAARKDRTKLDQWGYQVQCRVLARIGREKLWFVTDGIDPAVQKRISVTPILGDGGAQARAQRAIDEFLTAHPHARVAVIPDGPYTMIPGT